MGFASVGMLKGVLLLFFDLCEARRWLGLRHGLVRLPVSETEPQTAAVPRDLILGWQEHLPTRRDSCTMLVSSSSDDGCECRWLAA